jgi:hypothetical protein
MSSLYIYSCTGGVFEGPYARSVPTSEASGTWPRQTARATRHFSRSSLALFTLLFGCTRRMLMGLSARPLSSCGQGPEVLLVSRAIWKLAQSPPRSAVEAARFLRWDLMHSSGERESPDACHHDGRRKPNGRDANLIINK